MIARENDPTWELDHGKAPEEQQPQRPDRYASIEEVGKWCVECCDSEMDAWLKFLNFMRDERHSEEEIVEYWEVYKNTWKEYPFYNS